MPSYSEPPNGGSVNQMLPSWWTAMSFGELSRLPW